MVPDRSVPLPAMAPPPGREPERRLLRLRDGYETSLYVHHPPPGAPAERLPVLYMHGIQSHPGWFYGSALALADAGHTVYQPTRRGSGDNSQARGHAGNREELLDDVDAARRAIADSGQGDFHHLLGVSWGGKLLLAYAAEGTLRGRELIASLILISPGVVPRVDAPWRIKLRIAGSLVVQQTALYDIPLSEPELFTDNEAMREYLRADAFRLHRATARFLFESRRLDDDIRRARPGAINAPTTLMLASRDRIIDNARTRDVVERLAGENLRVVELEGCHTLDFEPDPTEFHRQLVVAVQRGEAHFA